VPEGWPIRWRSDYAGISLGNYNPQLGMAAAILLGEVLDKAGCSADIAAQGIGAATRVFRVGGDGRAWLGPGATQYVVSEAMHALAIPRHVPWQRCKREDVFFAKPPCPVPGADPRRRKPFARGRFRCLPIGARPKNLRRLTITPYSVTNPQADGPLGLFACRLVRPSRSDRQRGMSVGFIHGVMNTDNCGHLGRNNRLWPPVAFMDGDSTPMRVVQLG